MSYKTDFFRPYIISSLDDWRKLVIRLKQRNEDRKNRQKMMDELHELQRERKL